MRPGPGKYEGNLSLEVSVALSEYVGNGWHNEEFGEVNDFGWFALVVDPSNPNFPELVEPLYIVEEDEQGFFSYIGYEDKDAGLEHWKLLLQGYAQWDAERLAEQLKYRGKKKHEMIEEYA